MTGHEFTEDEIIKAFNECPSIKYSWIYLWDDKGEKAVAIKAKDVASLINRQKAEIERLNAVLSNEAIVPPIKIGQTVYSALAYDDEEDTIEEYTVDGVGYIDGVWFAWCEKDADWYKLGTEYCKPTREEAERALAERGKK